MGVKDMGGKINHVATLKDIRTLGKQTIEERACLIARYIIDSKDTVRGAAKKFGISKSTVHKDVTLKNGRNFGHVGASIARPIPESIEIKGVFLAEKNPVVKFGLVIK